MLTLNTQFERELKKRIADEHARILVILSTGNASAVPNYDTYRYYCGALRAFDQVVNGFCDEVNTIINKRD